MRGPDGGGLTAETADEGPDAIHADAPTEDAAEKAAEDTAEQTDEWDRLREAN